MDAKDEAIISADLTWKRYEACARRCSRVRRPRYFWLEPSPVGGPGLSFEDGPRGREIVIEGPIETSGTWEAPGWSFWSAEDPEARLPTFTRAIPRSRSPPGAPGLHRVRPHVLARYEQDCRRFPPYTYDDHFCLVPEGSAARDHCALARVARASEREVLMGFLPGHTRRSQKGYTGGVRALEYFAEDTVRCALVGNSFHTTVVASLLGGQLRALGFAHVAVPLALLTLR